MIQFAPEGNLVKLVQNGFMKTRADAVLWVTCLCLGVLYDVYAQIKLVVMRFQLPAIFCTSVRQYADIRNGRKHILGPAQLYEALRDNATEEHGERFIMAYTRPQNSHKLNKAEKVALLEEYIRHYENAMRGQGIEYLNAKIPREIFAPALDLVGELLQAQADQLLHENEDVQNFLRDNPLPPHMAEMLPDSFRVFALLLNSLKQWVSAESAATDRFLLGGTARQTCREAVTYCIVTGELLGDNAELHHPVRDGRPPILLSKKGHEIVERTAISPERSGGVRNVSLTGEQDKLWQQLQTMRSQRNQSWAQLREGCRALLQPVEQCRPGARSFANVAVRETGKTPNDILVLLDALGK